MWIVLGILGFLAALITIILLLPFKILAKNDAQDPLILRYKFLFKTFGENPNPDDPIIKMLKAVTGAERLDKQVVQQSLRDAGLQKTVSETFHTLASLLREIVNLLQVCNVSRLNVTVRCADDDIADAAIHYGQCCAAAYTLLDILGSFITLNKRNCHIDIGCDFEATQSLFRYDVVLTVRVWRLLKALWKVALQEAAKANKPQNQAK